MGGNVNQQNIKIMKNKIAILSAICVCSLAFVIACGAQNDTISTNETLIRELINDPLTEEFKTINQRQTDLLLYNTVDMQAILQVLKDTPGNDACKIVTDLSQIAHAVEYFDLLCTQKLLKNALYAKYPDIGKLSTETRVQLFYSSEPVTMEDVLIMIDTRSKID